MVRTKVSVVLCLMAFVACLPSSARAQEPPGWAERDPKEEQAIYDSLSAVSPDAASLFQEATRALDAGDYQAARVGYEAALALVPDSTDVLRRLSYAEAQLGDSEAAVSHARKAVQLDASPWNQYALVVALLSANAPADKTEALSVAQAAAETLPSEPGIQAGLLMAAAANERLDLAQAAAAQWLELAPDDPRPHYFVGVLAAADGRWELAETELLRSKSLGMPEADVDEMLDKGIRTQARMRRWLRGAGYATATWLGVLGLVLLLGLALSKATLALVARTQATGSFEVSRGERALRSIYRLVIAASSIYFYISIPFLILLVVAIVAGIIYLFLALGRIPVRLMLFIGLAGLYTLVAIVRSLFVRVRSGEPGRKLPLQEAPQLWALTGEVASKVGTRGLDAIYLTPGTGIAVTERGSLLKRMRGRAERSLILGLGVLPDLTQGRLRAILAHEYGHFSHRDTAGGDLANLALASIQQMGYGLAVSGQARWYNPAWLFVNGFLRVFLRVVLGASRLQEILADRYAAAAYGAQQLIDGLMHVIRQDLAFSLEVREEAKAAQAEQRDLRNLYALPGLKTAELKGELEKAVGEVMALPTSPYDSHPSPADRIRLLKKMPETGVVEEEPGPAWALLPMRRALQEEMTSVVRTNLKRREP